MAYTRYRGERVSLDHNTLLKAYEQRYGVPAQINEGARTIAEQRVFWNRYQKYGSPLAAFPAPGAPHIKYRAGHHALDINAGSAPGRAQHVAAFYRANGVQVSFNVASEPWHMDVIDRASLRRAAKKLRGRTTLRRGAKGPVVVRLKKLLYDKGLRNFSGRRSSNRVHPIFNQYTKAAVQRFQKANGLKADGVVGPKTWRKLRSK